MTRKVTWIGPWGDRDHSVQPMAWDHVDPEWDEHDRLIVSEHLEECGFLVEAPMDGYRGCWLCNESFYHGFVRTDGVFIWRTGLAHYVKEHSVRLPQAFLDHVRWIVDSEDPDPGQVYEDPWWQGVDPYSDTGMDVARSLSMGPALGSWEINTDHGHDPSKRMNLNVVELNFWADEENPNPPCLEDHVDTAWDEREQKAVELYLEQDGLLLGIPIEMSHACLLCGKPMQRGFIRTDGVYVWQTGLVHYVRDHSVRPPQPLIDRVNLVAREIADLQTDDMQWWDNDPYSHNIAVS